MICLFKNRFERRAWRSTRYSGSGLAVPLHSLYLLNAWIKVPCRPYRLDHVNPLPCLTSLLLLLSVSIIRSFTFFSILLHGALCTHRHTRRNSTTIHTHTPRYTRSLSVSLSLPSSERASERVSYPLAAQIFQLKYKNKTKNKNRKPNNTTTDICQLTQTDC